MKINEVTKKIEPSKPRNFVAKNATTSGAGQHKDKAKTIPRKEKHKGKHLDMAEDGNVTVSGVEGDVAKLSNGQEISAKTLAPDTTHPGQFTMPQTDPNAIKPGAVVNTGDQNTSEETEDEVIPVAPTDGGIHAEHDPDLMGSGHNMDVGGDATGGDGYERGYVNDVADKGFERANRNTGPGFAGRSKRLGENDELTKMLTIAGLK